MRISSRSYAYKAKIEALKGLAVILAPISSLAFQTSVHSSLVVKDTLVVIDFEQCSITLALGGNVEKFELPADGDPIFIAETIREVQQVLGV